MPLDELAVRAFDALRTGHRSAFLDAVRGNASLSRMRGPGGATPLMTAALYGDAALVRELLDAGADPNIADDAGATALMWAVDDLEKTRALVEHGADVNAISANRRKAILAACTISRNRDVVVYLLDHGANPSEKAPGLNDGTAPLTEAALLGDEDMIRLLLDRGGKRPGGGLPAAGAFDARSLQRLRRSADAEAPPRAGLDADHADGSASTGSGALGGVPARPRRRCQRQRGERLSHAVARSGL